MLSCKIQTCQFVMTVIVTHISPSPYRIRFILTNETVMTEYFVSQDSVTASSLGSINVMFDAVKRCKIFCQILSTFKVCL